MQPRVRVDVYLFSSLIGNLSWVPPHRKRATCRALGNHPAQTAEPRERFLRGLPLLVRDVGKARVHQRIYQPRRSFSEPRTRAHALGVRLDEPASAGKMVDSGTALGLRGLAERVRSA